MAAVEVKTLTIANGATTSSAFTSAASYAAYGLQVPDTFTGASISFEVAVDENNFKALYEIADATAGPPATQRQVTMAVTQGRSYDLPVALTAWPSWRIVSASSEGGARSLLVCGKRP